jgi:hypothetical protein
MPRLTAKALAALFKEWREDHEAANREDAHWYRAAAAEKDALRKILDGKTEAPTARRDKDRSIER